eukprot:1638008-Amphidinium_carterae.1
MALQIWWTFQDYSFAATWAARTTAGTTTRTSTRKGVVWCILAARDMGLTIYSPGIDERPPPIFRDKLYCKVPNAPSRHIFARREQTDHFCRVSQCQCNTWL